MLHARLLTSFCSAVLSSAVLTGPAHAENRQPQELKKLSIEELTQLEVTSVSRRSEQVSRTAAAVSVIRGDDVSRSGTTTLAEALRLAGVVDVAQVNGSTWGVSTRGFNISTANKLLVLIDGRSTYVPLFGGTFWDVQDAVLADIDRIEVIRGPGGTIWGANAVNGVVNVISRPAAETQGSTVLVTAGSNARAVATGRYGGRIGDAAYRIYGKYRHRGPQLLAAGGSAGDDVDLGQAGFRIDSSATASTRWLVSGLVYRGSLGFRDRDDGSTSGGHVLGRLTRAARGGEFSLQAYYDRSSRTIPMQFQEDRDTVELDAQHSLPRGRHNLMFGSTVRMSDARDTGIAGFVFDPERRTSWTLNAFVHDEFAVVPERFYVAAGTKVGRNNYTGIEWQPNVRMRLQDGGRQMAWAAVSRAVRLPTRFDTDLRLLFPSTGQVFLTGSDDFEAESVVAYEAGYRAMPHRRLSLDVAVFANDYDRLRSLERQPSGITVLGNTLNARTDGIELSAGYQATAAWRLHGSYAWLRKDLSFDDGSLDATRGEAEGNDPSHLAGVRSFLDLPHGTAIDAMLRYVGRRPAPRTKAYAELDVRFGWTARPGWELSLVGQNLMNRSHVELPSGGNTEAFRRAVFVRSLWRF